MSDKQTTNWYVCTECGMECDAEIIIDEYGVRVGLSHCCTAEIRVSNGKNHVAIDWNAAGGVVVGRVYHDEQGRVWLDQSVSVSPSESEA